MSDPEFVPRRMTFDEYLRFEMASDERHEFIDGVVYGMTGAALPHNRLALNVAARLLTGAGDGPCHVYMEGAKLRVGDDVFYPDVMVVCDRTGEDDAMAYAPCLLVEVLSPSTARRDRTTKRTKYQAIPSLRAYVVVSRQGRHVERHWRDAADTAWQSEEIADRGDVVIPCPVSTVLTLDEIYRGVDVGPPPLRRVRESPLPTSA